MTLRRLNSNRQVRVAQLGSPYFFHSFGVIGATTGREAVSVERSLAGAAKYNPLDYVELTNNSGENLLIEINHVTTERLPLPAGTVKTISGRPIWFLSIFNNTATATVAGEVLAVFQRLSR